MSTADPFWIARTEDAGGLIRGESALPSAYLARRYRLVTDLTDRLYRRCGFAPRPTDGPMDGDLYTMPLASADCALGNRAFGRIGGAAHADGMGSGNTTWAGLVEEDESHAFPDGYGWERYVDEVSVLLGLDKLHAEPGHENCRHTRVESAFPLMWRVGVYLRFHGLSGWHSGDRGLYTGLFPFVVEQLGEQVEQCSRFDREGRWVLLERNSGWCGLSPSGKAYVEGHVVDLAAMSRAGAAPGELAATVEDLLAWEELTPGARRWARQMRLAERARLPIARLIPELDLPDEIMIFASDDELVVTVGADASRAVVDSALGFGVGLARDRDLHLLLPVGREQTTLHRAAYLESAIEVWLHDGYRVVPIATPAEADVETRLGREPWAVTGHTAVPDMSHRWEIERSTMDGPRPIVLITGDQTLMRIHETVDLAGADDVLRCIDQWAWLRANLRRLAAFGMGPDEHMMAVYLDARQAQVEPLVPALIEAISRPNVTLLLAGDRPETWPVCTIPTTADRPEPPRSRRRRQAELKDHAARYGAKLNHWPSRKAAVFASARTAYQETAARGHIKGGFEHTTSTQAFALNVFAPTGAAGAASVLKSLGLSVIRAEKPEFAYRDPENRLREGSRPTVADVLLTGTTAEGLRVAALIAVKLTEDGFDPCTGFTDRDNLWRDTCRVSAPFGGAPATCGLLRRPGPRYLELLDLNHRSKGGGCPFRAGTEQMRLVALATALQADGEYDRIAVTLCTPAFQEPIQRRWDKEFPVGENISVEYIPVEVVVAITGHPDAALLHERYGIGTATQVAAPA